MKNLFKIVFISFLLLGIHPFGTFPIFSQQTGAFYTDFKVNDDTTTVDQCCPSIGVDGSGNFKITWSDPRNPPGRVYCQIFENDASRLGNNFGIARDTSSGCEVSVLKDGRFIIAFNGPVDSYYHSNIYQQRYNSNGTPISSWGMVNDVLLADSVVLPDYTGGIGADSLGNYVIVWTDYRYGTLHPNVYGQRYDSAGNKLGMNIRVNDSSYYGGLIPRIAVYKNGSFIIAWADGRSGTHIYIQRYDKYGNRIGNNQKVDDGINYGTGGVDIATDGYGYFVVAFGDCTNQYQQNQELVYMQLYDTSGSKIGSNQRVDDGVGYEGGYERVSMQSDKKIFISWGEFFGSGGKPMGQRYDQNGNRIGNNFYISTYNNFTDGEYESVYLFNDRIYSSWEDNRNSNYDIFANIRSFINPDSVLVGIEPKITVVNEFKLLPSFPNPFNPSTNIKYQIPKTSYVKIIVFDILGKEITTLVSEKQNAGLHKIIFDGTNFASGIYFVRFSTESGYNSTQKIVLLK